MTALTAKKNLKSIFISYSIRETSLYKLFNIPTPKAWKNKMCFNFVKHECSWLQESPNWLFLE